jgi:hypothetical protein
VSLCLLLSSACAEQSFIYHPVAAGVLVMQPASLFDVTPGTGKGVRVPNLRAAQNEVKT